MAITNILYNDENFRRISMDNSLMNMRQAYALDHKEQLEARLRMSIAEMNSKGVQHIFVAPTDGKVFLFCIVRGNPLIIIEDDEKMYPSDTLVTQLRTLMD